MREITLTRTKRRLKSFEDLLAYIFTSVFALVGVCVPLANNYSIIFKMVALLLMGVFIYDMLPRYYIDVEEEVTLEVVGGRK